ncbi:hypothetical protein C3E98_022930 [Pseudomonas sp. MWU13-2625]|nr:hypothetical protein C3E97_026145 [Pseudomonas sp. MWU12-2115]RBL69292.1 hypothetical protein C3E98_022930 [Pseudomonas sp. MWU13-2625]
MRLKVAFSQIFLCWLADRFRGQARSHIGSAVNTNCVNNRDLLWERACSRRGPQSRPSFFSR